MVNYPKERVKLTNTQLNELKEIRNIKLSKDQILKFSQGSVTVL